MKRKKKRRIRKKKVKFFELMRIKNNNSII